MLYAGNRKDFESLKVIHPDERVEDKNEELYYRLRGMFNGTVDKEYSDALLYYYINKTAYSGMIRYNARGEFDVPFGRYKHFNTKSVTLSHSKLLQQAELFNLDYSDIFNMCREDDFVFLDPPYDCVFSDYGNEYEKNYAVNIRNRFKSSARHIVVANYKKTCDDVFNYTEPIVCNEQ